MTIDFHLATDLRPNHLLRTETVSRETSPHSIWYGICRLQQKLAFHDLTLAWVGWMAQALDLQRELMHTWQQAAGSTRTGTRLPWEEFCMVQFTRVAGRDKGISLGVCFGIDN